MPTRDTRAEIKRGERPETKHYGYCYPTLQCCIRLFKNVDLLCALQISVLLLEVYRDDMCLLVTKSSREAQAVFDTLLWQALFVGLGLVPSSAAAESSKKVHNPSVSRSHCSVSLIFSAMRAKEVAVQVPIMPVRSQSLPKPFEINQCSVGLGTLKKGGTSHTH